MKSFSSTFYIQVIPHIEPKKGQCNLIHFKIEKVNVGCFKLMSIDDRMEMRKYIKECRDKLDQFENEIQ